MLVEACVEDVEGGLLAVVPGVGPGEEELVEELPQRQAEGEAVARGPPVRHPQMCLPPLQRPQWHRSLL